MRQMTESIAPMYEIMASASGDVESPGFKSYKSIFNFFHAVVFVKYHENTYS